MFDCLRRDTGKPLLVRHVELIIRGICWFVYSNYQYRDDGLQNKNRSPMFALNKREIITITQLKCEYDLCTIETYCNGDNLHQYTVEYRFIYTIARALNTFVCFSLFYSTVYIYLSQLSRHFHFKNALLKWAFNCSFA